MKNLDIITNKVNKVREIFLDFQKSGDLEGCTVDCEIRAINVFDELADVFVWVFLKNFDDYDKFLEFDKRLMAEFGNNNYILFPKDSGSAYKLPSEKFRDYRLAIDYFEDEMKKFDNYLAFKLYFANNGKFYVDKKYKENNVKDFDEEEFFKALEERCDIGYHNDSYNAFIEKLKNTNAIIRLTNIYDYEKVMKELDLGDKEDENYYLVLRNGGDDYDILSNRDEEFEVVASKEPDVLDDADFVIVMDQYNEQYLL